nr:hypothetical protein OG409_09380 [Streptomyces sp. NBC_00974]
MGFQGQVWRLVRRHELMGEIVVEELDFPRPRGRFVAGSAFATFEPLFARSRVLADAEDREGFDSVYEEIRKTLSPVPPSGPVAESCSASRPIIRGPGGSTSRSTTRRMMVITS